MLATIFERYVYQNLVKPVLFRYDPEDIHDRICAFGQILGDDCFIGYPLLNALFAYEHPALRSTVCGIRFKNPVGLAAGFDKNARLTNVMSALGFGFEEVGSITGEPCSGNAKPRLWRLPNSQALVVHYGLKNEGCEAVASRLRHRVFPIPLGTSVAKTNSPATVSVEEGVADYKKAFQALANIGDYFTVNISCPNAFGGEPFADPEKLEMLLTALDTVPTVKPIFLKIAADLTVETLDTLVAVADRHRVHGFVLTNLTKDRTNPFLQKDELKKVGKGGISGRPLVQVSNTSISHLYRTAGKRYRIIGVGGIFSAQDAYEKIRRGASLVQLITGLIYEGPQLVGDINRDLVRLLKQDGFDHIQQAVGSAETGAG